MTEKGKEITNNMKLVADELLKLLNTINKKEDIETKQQRMEHINKLKQSGIPLELLNDSIIMINKYLNYECSFDDVLKSFIISMNKKEEQKATEPKLSDTDIENAKQTNKIWQEYLEKQNKSIFEKIKDSSNKYDNSDNIFADIPDVNIKIHERPSIDMLKDLFLNNRAEDKNKEKDLSPEEQQKIFKVDFVYPKDLYNMLEQSGAFYKKTQDNKTVKENKEKRESNEKKQNSEIQTELSFMEKILKEHYDKVLSSISSEKSTIDDIMKRFDSLEQENKKINNRLDKLINENEGNIKFIGYIAEKLLTVIKILDIDRTQLV